MRDELDPWEDGMRELLQAGGWPVVLHQHFVLQPGKNSYRIDFAPRPGTASRGLSELPESALLGLALSHSAVTGFLARQLDTEDPWILIEEQRESLLPDTPSGKPGDFDMIVGGTHGGRLDFSHLCSVELKIRKLDGDGRPRSYASGRGSKQAVGAAELGFDRVLLLHLLVREAGDQPTRGAGALATNVVDAALASAKLMIDRSRAQAPFGFAMLGWGQVSGTDPALTGGFSPIPVWDAPLRPLHGRTDVRAARERLEEGVRRVLGTRRPYAPFFRRCGACRAIFGTNRPTELRCGDCS